MDLVAVRAANRTVVGRTLSTEIQVGVVELVVVELHCRELVGTQGAGRARVLQSQSCRSVSVAWSTVCVERRDATASLVTVEWSLPTGLEGIQLLLGRALLKVERLLLGLELLYSTIVRGTSASDGWSWALAAHDLVTCQLA